MLFCFLNYQTNVMVPDYGYNLVVGLGVNDLCILS